MQSMTCIHRGEPFDPGDFYRPSVAGCGRSKQWLILGLEAICSEGFQAEAGVLTSWQGMRHSCLNPRPSVISVIRIAGCRD